MNVRACLLAAEADQIQDYILRSSRLQEVVGASDLLSAFCREAPGILKGRYPDMEVLVNDAGTFRLCFSNRETADRAGACLSELFLQITGGSLSVSKSVEIGDDFSSAMARARSGLQDSKRGMGKMALPGHVPWMTFCTSCGTGLGEFLHEDGGRHIYLCGSCHEKRVWRGYVRQKDGKSISLEDAGNGFLRDFHIQLHEIYKGSLDTGQLKLPVASQSAGCRADVAYLLADANGAGFMFDRCQNGKALRDLSLNYRKTLAAALAKPCASILEAVESRLKSPDDIELPIMPYILGGDDCFAKVPAYCAIDVAAGFCREFYDRLKDRGDDEVAPTMGVAVVICKENYPYRLAYAYAHDLLQKAKQVAKQVSFYDKQPVSTVNFAVISGNQLPQYDDSYLFRGTLRPYLVPHNKFADTSFGGEISEFLTEAKNLRQAGISSKRLHDLSMLYDYTRLGKIGMINQKQWAAELELMLGRMGRNKKQRDIVKDTIQKMGDKMGDGYWRRIEVVNSCYWANGTADLINMLDFSLGVDECPWEDDR